MICHSARTIGGLLAGLTLVLLPIRGGAAGPGEPLGATIPPSYADLVDLVDSAPLIVKAQIRKLAPVEPAPGVRTGWARVYIEAQTVDALRGEMPPGPVVSYLADVPLNARGRLPDFKKRLVLLLARRVAAQPAMLQLIAPDAQLPWSAELEVRLRGIMRELAAPDAPGPITAVREAIYVPGTLVGEGETQIFLATPDGSPASISVVREPGQPVSWTLSFSEVVNASGQPPAHDTLAWYRLACTLPDQLPAGINVSESDADKIQAQDDYRLVKAGLGACGRTR
jgi:hypothetical protein